MIMHDAADAAAKAIGISADQLRQELPGKSLADVAKNHNADPTKVADAIKAQLDTRIDQAVSNGRLTADQATQAKQRVSTQVDQMMTRQVPQRPVGPPRGPRGLRRPGQPRQPGQPQPQGTARTSSASAGTI